MKKVILISIDGMRPDGLLKCGNPFVDELKKVASYSLEAKTVFPSITLPCHLSLFHSVPPERHGTLNNTYSIPVRPVGSHASGCGLWLFAAFGVYPCIYGRKF